MIKLIDRFFYELDIGERIRWSLHNGVAHPLMLVLPRSAGKWLHDVTVPPNREKEETPHE